MSMARYLLSLLIVFVLTATSFGAYLGEDQMEARKMAVVQNSWAGGQNNRDFEGTLGPTEAARVYNAVIEDNGVIKKRDGLTLLGDDTGNNAILGIGVFTHSTAGATLVRAETTVVKRLAGSSWTNITTGLTTGLPTEFIVANNLLFILNGTDRIRYSNGAFSITTFGSGSDDPPLAKIGVFLKERMFLVDENNPSRIRYSAAGDTTDFPAANDIPINEDDGQRIMALVAFKNDLLVFKEQSIWTLAMEGADPVSDWAVSSVDANYGTLSTNSVQLVGGDIVFLDQFGKVRSLIRTQLDTLQPGARPFSDTVRPTLDTLNRAQISKVAAAVWEDDYLLAFPANSSTYNDTVIVYNTRQKSWVEYTGWSISSWTRHEVSNVFYLIGGEASADSLSYQCYKGNSDNGTDIDFDLQTREYTLDFPGDKIWELADVVCHVTSGDLTLSVQVDSGGWQSLGALDMAGDAPALPQTLPFNLGSEAIAEGKYHLTSFGRARGIRFRFRSNNTDEVTLRELIVFARLLRLEK